VTSFGFFLGNISLIQQDIDLVLGSSCSTICVATTPWHRRRLELQHAVV
jgi:hypothetical protein